MQKFTVKFKNEPVVTSLDHCSSSSVLNKEETPSVQGKVRAVNNLEVNLHRKVEHSILVFVLSKKGVPLISCTPKKARQLLNQNKVKAVKRFPFTIQFLYGSSGYKQPISLGIDSGAKFVGFSAVTDSKELISGTLNLDLKTSERLKEKAMYRRGRRSKLWYRPARFNNRKGQELPPSILRKYESHLNLINKIKKLLPITSVTIEVGNFDIQKIINPEINGVEYQQGSRFGYENTKAFIIAREKCLCQLCGKTILGTKINLHHIIQQKDGGTDRAINLALLHDSCHEKLHKKGLKLRQNKQYKEPTFMNIIKNRFSKDLVCTLTFGFETFCKRMQHNISKTHSNDAFVIANGSSQTRTKPFIITQKHINNRVLQLNRKGFKPSIKKEKSIVNPLDLFKVNGKSYICKGMFNKGKYICYGSTKNKEYFKFSEIQSIFKFGSLAWAM